MATLATLATTAAANSLSPPPTLSFFFGLFFSDFSFLFIAPQCGTIGLRALFQGKDGLHHFWTGGLLYTSFFILLFLGISRFGRAATVARGLGTLLTTFMIPLVCFLLHDVRCVVTLLG